MCSQRTTSKKRSEASVVMGRKRSSYARRRQFGAVSPAVPATHGPAATHDCAPRRLDVRLVLAEDVTHRPAHLAHRARVLQRLADVGDEVVGAARGLAQLLEAP